MVTLDKDYNKKLLAKSEKLLEELPPDFKKYITPTSWTTKAQENLKTIDKVKEIRDRWLREMRVDMSPIPSIEQLNELSASVLELDDLCEVLEWRKKINGRCKKAFEDNLRQILKMPLTIDKETYDKKNQGRNKLFESSLFIKFKKAGYSVELRDNPDLIVDVNERKYAIECKRIFKKDTFKDNINFAISKLGQYSLAKTGTLGIVAIDYSRYFTDMPIQVIANSEAELRYKFNLRDAQFATETIETFKNTNFGPLIPFMFLNHRSMGYVLGLPYSFNHLNIQETDAYGARAYKDILLEDFGQLMKSVNDK